jgi:hypothetical protein
MKKTMKIFAWMFGSVAFVAIVSAGLYMYLSAKDSEPKAKPTLNIKEDQTPKGEKMIEVTEKRSEPVEEEFPMEMDEYDVQDAIHGMTHQKIVADDKWGFIPLTQERVKRLIVVVEKNGAEYEKSGLYMHILNRWLNGDFTEIDKEHNAIWELQGGNVGKATGIMSAEEEKAFIKEHYDINE